MTDKKLIAGGMMFWTGGTFLWILCIVVFKLVMDVCQSMGCIPAMLAFTGMIAFAPAPILLILSIFISRNHKWPVIPYYGIITLLCIFMVLGLLSRIKANAKKAEMDRIVTSHVAKVEAANRATYNLVLGETHLDDAIETIGRPDAMQERYGVGILVLYYNEAMCARMDRTQLELTFDIETKRIKHLNCR